MTKQVLDLEQMLHLREMGLELKETMLYWARCVDNNPRAATHYGKWVLIKGNNAQTVGLMHWEFIPAYTLQDVLDALPESILKNDIQYWLSICRATISIWMISYSDDVDLTTNLHHEEYESLIDAAYSMLCWCIENKFVETNKKTNEV